MKLSSKLLNITSTEIKEYPGDEQGDSIVLTGEGMAGKGETAQKMNLSGIVSNPPNETKSVVMSIGNLDVSLGSINYKIPLPENQGETMLYSTDDEGNIKSKVYLDKDGVFTFNDGDKEAARNGDKVTVTIPAGTFIVSVSGGSGAPAVGVLNPTPIDVDGTIKEGTSEVLFP